MSDHSYSEDRVVKLDSVNQGRAVRIWEAPHPSALIVGIHGGMAHSGDFETVGSFFRPSAITTISFDLSGHGSKARIDVTGLDVFLNDVVRMLQWVCNDYPDLPLFIAGHSMGGLIAAHLELSGRLDDFPVKGIVLSSPYFENAIPVPPLMIHLSRLLANVLPTAKVPMESFSDWLTHDRAIAERHRNDEKMLRRGTEASFRFGRALLDAQAALDHDLSRWHHPVFAVVAGDDRLANAQTSLQMLNTIPAALRELHSYAGNFHENFNELNREAIFADLLRWMQARI